MMLRMISILSVLLLVGCNKETIGDKPCIEMQDTELLISEQVKMCELNPTSIFCTTTPSVGDIQPTKKYALETLCEMNSNFTYKIDDTWHYNQTVFEELEGDCENIASTMAQDMVNDGIDKKYLHLALRKLDDGEFHLFLAVDTVDAGMLHLDYYESGYPIERINFHMRLDDAGVDKWIKGDIQ